jgi:hypothetical protein
VKPRTKIALWAALVLAAGGACTQGNSHFEVASPSDGPGAEAGAPLPGQDAGPWADVGAYPDVVDPGDSGPVVTDTGPPMDAGLPRDTAPDAPLPPDTAPADTLAADTTPAPVNGLRVEYFSDPNLGMKLFESVDSIINYGWVHDSPDDRVPNDDFSVRWTGRIRPRYSERYTFYIVSDDGARLVINGQTLIEKWESQSSVENSGQITLQAGTLYDLTVEYFDQALTATVRFSWSSSTQGKQIVPASQLFMP